MITKFTAIQKERVEGQLNIASTKGDVNSAKRIIMDLQPILTATGNTARLMQAKIRLYEASMELGDVHTAVNGLLSIRAVVNKNTRTFLEATTLLAICYLRLKDLVKSEPLIRAVLINDKVITSEEKRRVFRKNVIERFDEEGLLFSLRESKTVSKFDYKEIENEAGILIQSNIDDDKLFEDIGNVVPNSSKNLLEQVDSFSKKQLPSAERIALPSGKEIVRYTKAGIIMA